MICEILKFVKKPSRNGGYYYHTFLKGVDNGQAYFTYLAPKMRNWSRWKKVLKKGVVLKGLRIKKGKLIDADSRFIVIENE